MLLDRIEIDSHGPLNHVELGPLSHHLNVVLGAPGSGKTAISRFIRDSLIDREYPRGMLSGSAGRVVWVDPNGWIHCRREQDGTPGGRRTVEFESRGEIAGIDDGYRDGWFDNPAHAHDVPLSAASPTASLYRSSLASRTLGSIRIPESIVDGVMVDTTISSVSRVVAACLAAGLDRADLARMPFGNETAHYAEHDFGMHSNWQAESMHDDRARRALRSELADVEVELAKLSALADQYAQTDFSASSSAASGLEYEALMGEREGCIRRRDELVARREQALRNRARCSVPEALGATALGSLERRVTAARSAAQWAADEARLRTLHQRADSLRSRAAELQRWIVELDTYRSSSADAGYSSAADYPAATHFGHDAHAVYRGKDGLPPHWQTDSTEHLHSRIRAADQEIVSLRRVLADVRGLRSLLHASVSASQAPLQSYDWLDDTWMNGRRYDHFVRAIDRYRSDRPWSDFYASAYRPLRPIDDLAMRIEATTRHLDWLLSRFESAATPGSAQSLHADTWMLGSTRDEVIEQSLRRVREQLRQGRYLSPMNMDAISAELTRALDHLTAHRRRVVESLAAHHRTWKQDFAGFSSVHPDWINERRAATAELASVEQELRRVLDETAAFRYSQRYLPIIDPDYPIGMSSAWQSNLYDGQPHGDHGQAEVWRAEIRQLDSEIARQDVRIRDLDQRIHSYQARPAATPAPRAELDRLHRRRDELLVALGRARPVTRHESSLMELASRWLVRLSGGRHRMVRWTTSSAATDPYTTMDAAGDPTSSYHPAVPRGSVEGRRVHVSIDNMDERSVPAAIRAVACLATRMAAGELLGRMGHAIPLVLETHGELFSATTEGTASRQPGGAASRQPGDAAWLPASHGREYQNWTREGINSDTLSAAFADYAAAGRQLLILTEHAGLADFLRRSGARHFALHTQRIIHPHQPLWRGGQRHDRYVGPHAINEDGVSRQTPHDEMQWTEAGAANRAFDRAWRESAGLQGDPVVGSSYDARATDIPAAGASYRDGYYYTDQSSTHPMATESPSSSGSPAGPMVSQSLTARHNGAAASEMSDVPFFLSVDSPIDAAPSIDAVAAQRLRRIGISHITHLMNQDSNRLADTLGLAGVDARTVRRWQAECRLMCRVPQLRGFDARVLVGCGINDPAQLAAIHPTDLLDRVKTFLATERGQRILLSGTSYELSRITSWIASANQSVQTSTRARTVDGRGVRTRVVREDAGSRGRVNPPHTKRYVENDDVDLTDDDFDQERYEVRVERQADRIVDDLDELARDYDGDGSRLAARSARSSTASRARTGDRSETTASRSRGFDAADRSSSERTRRQRDWSRSREGRRSRSSSQASRSDTHRLRTVGSESTATERNSQRASQGESDGNGRGAGRDAASSNHEQASERELRFYLHRDDDVVDAPSIGPRMTERLNRIGIYTVDDLLQADSADLAARLNHRRVEAATVLQWQQQATLVCRVPMMRGHDAQFLVAAGVCTAEELAVCDPVSLFADVEAIAHSSEGKRIARGGKLPDLEEVTEWIDYAAQHRSLEAA